MDVDGTILVRFRLLQGVCLTNCDWRRKHSRCKSMVKTEALSGDRKPQLPYLLTSQPMQVLNLL